MFVARMKNQAQGMAKLILMLGILVAVFFINLIIKENLDNDTMQPTASSASDNTFSQKNINDQKNPASLSSQNGVPIPSKSEPKNSKNSNKEIIYEPSIKDNLLVQ